MNHKLVPTDTVAAPVVTPGVQDDPVDELPALARELAQGYAAFVETYRTAWTVSHTEAETRLRQIAAGDRADRAASAPPDQSSWWGLSRVIEQKPEQSYRIWQRLKAEVEDPDLKMRGYYLSPRVSATQAMGQSAAMADRFHRMFVRSLRTLRDLRRNSNSVIVQQAGQVNGGSQQVNVAPVPER
jgi:hypothetical protein